MAVPQGGGEAAPSWMEAGLGEVFIHPSFLFLRLACSTLEPQLSLLPPPDAPICRVFRCHCCRSTNWIPALCFKVCTFQGVHV